MFDVLIVGAGVIGSMLARELSHYELSVCVLEKENDVAMGASKANSGIIHGGYDPKPGTLKAKLNAVGVDMLYAAAKELNVRHQKNGSMVCAFGDADNAAIDALLARGKENGIEGLSVLTGKEARMLEPNLSDKVTRALHVPTAGIICPYDLTISAMGNAMDNGVSLLREFEVVSVKMQDGFAVTSEDGRTAEGKYLINCAGCNSDRIAALAGDDFFKIIPRAGEYLLLDKTEGGRVKHTVFQVPSAQGKGILVTPTADGNLLLGPTAERVASCEETYTTPVGIETVLRLAKKSVPSVDVRQVITSFAGVRASEKGGDFIIEASRNVENLIHVAAIDSPGLTCCAAIAKYVTQLLREQGAVLNEKEYWDGTRKSIHTFSELSEDEQDAYIQEHPEYGKIVCRCETISEGEIREAIRRNPPALDVDGVKRRTRGGMGRCQGGFCSPYILRMIAEEHGILEEEVTKKGKNSRILMGKL